VATTRQSRPRRFELRRRRTERIPLGRVVRPIIPANRRGEGELARMVDRLVPSGWRSQLRDPMITRTRSDDHQNVDRLAGIVLDCGMLPIGTCKPDVSPTNPGGEPVYRVLLTQ
jgi:hypothetical protein